MYFNFQYLNSLIDEVKEVRENFEIHKLNTNLCSVTYLSDLYLCVQNTRRKCVMRIYGKWQSNCL